MVKQGRVEFSPGDALGGDMDTLGVSPAVCITSSGCSNMLKVRLTFPLGRLNLGRLRGAIGEPSKAELLPPLPITFDMEKGFAGGGEAMMPGNPTFFSSRVGESPKSSSNLI